MRVGVTGHPELNIAVAETFDLPLQLLELAADLALAPYPAPVPELKLKSSSSRLSLKAKKNISGF